MLFTFLPLLLNKIQTLSSLHIVCVCLVLCSWLFDYKFALICSSVIIMFNLIIIIIKKKICQTYRSNSIYVGWVGWVGLYDKLGWVEFFLPHHGRLDRKNYSTRSMHTPNIYTCKISRKLKTNYYAINQMIKFQICNLK